MVSQAEEIRDFLFDEWSLTGELSKTPLENMKEIVYFFDRKQVEGNEQTKAITVEKINDEENENIIEHPAFTEVQDWYVITLFLRAVDVQQPAFSEALTNVEDMAREVRRILKLKFSPGTGIGPYFLSRTRWMKRDMVDQAQPELIRVMEFQLTQITSADPEVFKGFGGVIIFDTGDSEGDNLPASDYQYAQLIDVTMSEGFSQIPYLTKDVFSLGRGIPFTQRGMFSGRWIGHINAKKDDIEGTTAEKIYNLIRLNTNSPLIGQNTKATLLHTVSNSEDPTPATFTTKSFLKIDKIEKLDGVENLISFRLNGVMRKPSEAIIG